VARVGQKGRATHVWFEKGVRPTAPADKRFASVYLFGAVRAGTDEAFALVMPFATAAVMSVFLQDFSKSLAPNAHAVLVLDKAGWHTTRRRRVPETISLVLLPAYSPELNPMERVWLYLREQSLSHRVWDTVEAYLRGVLPGVERPRRGGRPPRLTHRISLPRTGQNFVSRV
jgi:DDE superfamily endonuclease